MKALKSIIHNLGRRYVNTICEREFKAQEFEKFNERSVEFRFVFQELNSIIPTHRHVIDVGTGETALPNLIRSCGFIVTAIDNVKDYWPSGMINRHWHVINDDILSTKLSDRFDVITCISVLEHIPDHRTAVKSMLKLLRPGGILILTCPYNENRYCSDVYQQSESIYGKGSAYVCQSFSREELNRWILDSNAIIVKQEYWQFFEGELWTFGPQVKPRQSTRDEPHQHTCLVIASGDSS